jgi:hypothetical protein
MGKLIETSSTGMAQRPVHPGSRRHDLKAIVAYGSYKKSPQTGPQPASEAHPKGAGVAATETPSLDEWEDGGGTSR